MTAPRELQKHESLQSHWEEAALTHATLAAHPLTTEQAKAWTLLIESLDECSRGQRACWLGELGTQASCSHLNYRLDALIEEFHSAKIRELRAKNRGWKDKDARASAEFFLYFGSLRPFELIRLALESQLPLMESWPQKLSQETSEELRAFGERFQTIIDAGKAALKARDEARAKTALHRIKEINGLVERLNKQRLATYTELLQLAQQEGEAKSWPETFFAKATHVNSPQRQSPAPPSN